MVAGTIQAGILSGSQSGAIRPIPEIDVKLDDFMDVPIFHTFSSKDFMPKIWGTKKGITIHSAEYKNAVENFNINASKKETKKPILAYLVDSDGANTKMILLYNAMILSPSVLDLNTVLDLSGKTRGEVMAQSNIIPSNVFRLTDFVTGAAKRTDADKPGAGGKAGQKKNLGEHTWDFDNMAFEPLFTLFAAGQDKEAAGQVRGKQILMFTQVFTKDPKPTMIRREGTFGDINPDDLKAADNAKKALDTANKGGDKDKIAAAKVTLKNSENKALGDIARFFQGVLKSIPFLSKNQPFYVKVRMQEMPTKYKKFVKSGAFNSQFHSRDIKEFTSLEIMWGTSKGGSKTHQFRLVISASKNRNVILFRNISVDGKQNEWKQVGRTSSLNVKTKGEGYDSEFINLCIYPLGRNLIISEGIPTTEDSLKGNLIVYSFNELLSIEESQVVVFFNGGKTDFAFNPIIHAQSARWLSPPANVGFDPLLASSIEKGGFFLKVDYEGKFSNDYFGDINSLDEVICPLPTPEDSDGPVDNGTKKKGKTKKKKSKKTKQYQYLENTKIAKKIYRNGKLQGNDKQDTNISAFIKPTKKTTKQDKQSGKGDFQFKYSITLESHKAKGDVEGRRVFSPIIFKIELTVFPPFVRVLMKPSPQIKNADVMRVEINQTVQESSASVTLLNRHPPEIQRKVSSGIYTFNIRQPSGNFTGVKPITIKGGIQGANFLPGGQVQGGIIPQMKGFVSERIYNRPSPAESSVTLTIQDISKSAKEQFAVNLPIMDGWCHNSAMYVLMREAGYRDDQILFHQDPRTGESITIRQIMEDAGTNVSSRSGGCFAGHVKGFPKKLGAAAKVTNLPPTTIHALLPLNAFREQPNYMFKMGHPLWSCMQEIREFTGYVLFPNNLGNLIYSPHEVALGVKKGKTKTDWKFFEVSKSQSGGGGTVDPSAFSQYQRHLDVPFGTDHVRNAVMTWALIQADDDPTNPVKYQPVVIIKRQEGWPFNVNDPSYVPWLRWIIARSPYWNDLARAQQNTQQRFIRGVQPRITPSFGAWGHAGVFPYDIVQFDEKEGGETGVDQLQCIVQSVSKTFDGVSKRFDMEVNCEYVNFQLFEWSPHVHHGPVQNQSPN